MSTFRRFVKDDSGATAIEYGLIAALIAIVIIASVDLVGDRLILVFQAIAAALLETLPAESRTSLGDPVEPEVLSRRARSGWRSWALCGRSFVILPFPINMGVGREPSPGSSQ